MIEKILINEKDRPLLNRLLRSFLLIFPSASYMLFSEFSVVKALIYLALIVTPQMLPYACYIHAVIHREIFKKRYKFINHLHYWLVGIFIGETPYTHYTHHIGMHHPENNHKGDLSSTMMYKRDSFIDFIKYLCNFVLFGGKLFSYLARKKRYRFLKLTAIGEVSFLAITAFFLYLNLLQAITVFIIPLIIMRSSMATINWSQHAFLDGKALNNNYKICTTIINSKYNTRCFNDAYHIEHHSYPREHWSQLPQVFAKNREKYIKNRSVIFHTITYVNLFFLLMFKRYKTMAKYFVDLSGSISQDEIILLLKERTRKIVA